MKRTNALQLVAGLSAGLAIGSIATIQLRNCPQSTFMADMGSMISMSFTRDSDQFSLSMKLINESSRTRVLRSILFTEGAAENIKITAWSPEPIGVSKGLGTLEMLFDQPIEPNGTLEITFDCARMSRFEIVGTIMLFVDDGDFQVHTITIDRAD